MNNEFNIQNSIQATEYRIQDSSFMKLSIYSLKKIIFAGEASLLNCQTAAGEITVLDNHETYVGILKAGAMRVVDKDKKENFFEIKSGFMEVRQGNEVRCMVE